MPGRGTGRLAPGLFGRGPAGLQIIGIAQDTRRQPGGQPRVPGPGPLPAIRIAGLGKERFKRRVGQHVLVLAISHRDTPVPRAAPPEGG